MLKFDNPESDREALPLPGAVGLRAEIFGKHAPLTKVKLLAQVKHSAVYQLR